MGYYGFQTTMHVDELDRFMRVVRRIEKARPVTQDDIDELVAVAPYIAFCIEKGIPPEDRDWDLDDGEKVGA